MKRQQLIGALLTALFAGSVIAISSAAVYLAALNSGEKALIESPARAYADALAQRVALAPSPPAAQEALAAIRKTARELREVSVIVEPRSTKYRFLRKRRFLAHGDQQKVGAVLDKASSDDKALYDVASRVRAEGKALLDLRAPRGAELTVLAAAPVMRDGEHYATAVVITAPQAPAVPAPAWPLFASAFALLAFALLAALFAPRLRHILVLLGVVGLAAFSWWWSSGVAASYTAQLAGSLTSLEQALGASAATDATYAAPSPWALVLGTFAALAFCLLALFGVGRRMANSMREHRLAYTLLIPAGLGMALLVFLPFIYGLGLGFFNHHHGEYDFVGLKNFVEILSGGDRPLSHPLNFYFTLGVTILWTALNVFLHLAIGLGLALVLKDPLLRFKGIYRALLILPWAMPNYITALIWKGMFHYQYGAVNHVLETIGLEKVSWFSSFSTAFIANVVTNTWLGFPFMMVVSLGALQSIPADVYEAAAVDGAPRHKTFFHITLPLLRPALYPAIVLGSIWTFNMFNIIYLVSAGAPNGSSDILITEAYRWAFQRGDRYGLAAAYALIIFVVLFFYSKIANRLSRVSEEV